ncbi:MAG: lipid IV(A) 3-deoxy-D-manno-octulosonic acid transferase [Gammaproteobacteria bacterium]
MRLLYSIVLYLLTPFVVARLLWLGFRDHEYWKGWPQRFGFITVPVSVRPLLWIHAVSVGEVQAAVPLVQRLLAGYSHYQILLTTVTPTGAAMVRQRFAGRVPHCYLPYDLPGAVNRFLRSVCPETVFIMETELWPNLFHQCHKHGIRIFLINARMSPRSFAGYKRAGLLTRQLLSRIDGIAAQTGEDSQRFISLGAEASRVHVTGNLKCDVNVPPGIVEQARSLRRFFSVARPVWIAASTHEGEEALILDAHCTILEKRQSCLLIMAPRHPERFGRVAGLSVGKGFRTVCKSQVSECAADVQVYILDTLGELPVYYAASDVAFVGGSLAPACGGHNVLEPASLGIPVISGGYTQNFTEINRLLMEQGAEWQVSDSRELAEKVELLLADGNLRHRMGKLGKEMVEQNRGSTDLVMKLIGGNLSVHTSDGNSPG